MALLQGDICHQKFGTSCKEDLVPLGFRIYKKGLGIGTLRWYDIGTNTYKF